MSRLTFTLISVLALAALADPARAQWQQKAQRQKSLAEMADRHGIQMGTASDHTTWKLNEFLRPETLLPRQNVRITNYATWWNMAQEAQGHVIGGAATPHAGGAHLYLVSGTWLSDSIDRSVNDRFFDTGTKTRRQFIGNGYHYPRIFFLWKAPVEALTLTGLESERIVRDKACEGYNCAVLMARTLGKEGEAHPTSPFRHRFQLMTLERPVTHSALKGIGNVGPDMVVQVLSDQDFANVQRNWEGHEINFW
jgi:hypothetical protein